MSSKKLVITADDFGYDPATNDQITELLEGGYVTATTIIAMGDLDVTARQLGVVSPVAGLHFVNNSDAGRRPWHALTGSQAPLVADAETAEQRARSEEVVAELNAQYNLLIGRGFEVSRLDSHSGTLYGLHGNPMLSEALQFCAAKELAFRFPRDIEFLGEVSPEIAALHAGAVQAADQLGVRLPQTIITNPVSADLIPDYGALLAFYVGALALLPDGTSELFMHPSADSEYSKGWRGWQKRVWEAQVLRDPVWLDALAENGVELVSTW